MDYTTAKAVFDKMTFNYDDGSTILDGLVFKKVALALVFYFYEDEALRSRTAIVKIVKEYMDILGPKLRWAINQNSGEWKAFENGYPTDSALDEWLMKAGHGAWQFTCHGGQDYREASDIEIGGMGNGSGRLKKRLSWLYCYFPFKGYFDQEQEMADLAHKWAEMLKPFHGYGGVTLVDSHDKGAANQVPSVMLDSYYTCAYPGVNINRVSIDADVLTEEIKSADWLTFLSDHFLEKLGGSDEMQLQLIANSDGERLIGQFYPGGIMIMAGPKPSVGAGTGWDDRGVKHVRHVARILEPIRKKDHPGYFPHRDDIILEDGCKYLNPDQFRAWLARFSPEYMTIKPVPEVLPGKRPRIKR
ncbi:hypothetical protein C4J81_00700 [Deltaproteobacteria bacterium Smac51]|nr:hypothetical protein C4J81_00700 [Deltaproteobacteria bacterium Smac51]